MAHWDLGVAVTNDLTGCEAFEVSGIRLTWQVDEGRCTFEDLPVAMMWVGSTLAGLMAGLQAMVGPERFALALQKEGRSSIEDDWRVIQSTDSFEAGFQLVANIAAVAGWGRWELLDCNREERRCVFAARGNWESSFQQALGVCWGSGMLAGKFAGYSSKLFGVNCWAEQVAFVAKGADRDLFEVTPSPRSIEADLDELLLSDEATRADMAVALTRLREEIQRRERAQRAQQEAQEALERRVEERTRELQQANRELSNSEAQFRLIVDVAPYPIVITPSDPSQPPLYVNRHFTELFGYARHEIHSVFHWFELAYPDDVYRAEILEHTREVVSRGEVPPLREYRVRCKNGETRDIMWRTIILGDGRLMSIAEDLTEQKRGQRDREMLATQRHRASKMEALGLLAGGVAHDLNNILSGVVSYPDLLIHSLTKDDPLLEPLTTIRDAGERAALVVHDLLTITRGAVSISEVVELNDVVAEVLESPEFKSLTTTHAGILIESTPCAQPISIKCSPVHLKKCLFNLLTNAFEAIGGARTGRVQVVVNRQERLPKSADPVLDAVGYAVIEVRDDGPGIDPEDLEHIFEPFFTSKVMGRSGTGLGLAVVWNTIKDHRGHIDVRSGATGTTFLLYLPLCDQPADESEALPALERGSGECILVVDDEKTQLRVTTELLAYLGYRVVPASDGRAALDAIRERHDIALVVLDMIMPRGWSGLRTFEEIQRERSGIPTLIVSGYAETGDVAAIQQQSGATFLPKPFTMAELGLAVQQALHSRSGS